MRFVAIWIRTIGERALPLILALFALLAICSHFELVDQPQALVMLTVIGALIMTMPLAALIFEPEETCIERRWRVTRSGRRHL